MTDSMEKSFLAVAEYRSFSRAAAALYVSQPAVSKNISTLEAELGGVLFDRHGKNVELTRAGEIFLSFLTEYRREYDSMLERIRQLESGPSVGTIRIGCSHTWNAAHFYDPLAAYFAENYPGIELEVEGLEPEFFIPSLRRREVDVILMYSYDPDLSPDLSTVDVGSIGSGFLCSAEHMEPGVKGLKDLSDLPFIVVSYSADHLHSVYYRQHVTDLCSMAGFTPSFRICRSLSAGLIDLSCGKGVLMADDWTAAICNSRYHYIPVPIRAPICLAYLSSPTDSLLNTFLEGFKKVFGRGV